MANPGSAADFRARAAEARREADKAKSPEIVGEFIRLAELWERLAKKADKNEPRDP